MSTGDEDSEDRRIRGLTAEQRRLRRREQLLSAALTLFAAKGYAGVTVDQVCQAAYVSTKSFYVEFANKEHLFLELYDEVLRGAEEAVLATDLTGLDEPARARARIASFVHACVDDPRVARIAFLEAPGLSPAVEVRRREAHHRFAAYIESLARPHVAAGAIAAGRGSHRGAVALVGAINEVIIDWVLDPDPDPIEQVIDHITAVFAAIRRPDGAELLGPDDRPDSAET